MTTKGGGAVGRIKKKMPTADVSICRSLMECCVFALQRAPYLEQSEGAGEGEVAPREFN